MRLILKLDTIDDTRFRHEVDSFVQCCSQNYLKKNVCKTKEMVIGFRRNMNLPDCVVNEGVELERVEAHTYIGVVFDNGFSWTEITNTVIKKAHTRLYCLRILRSFNTSAQSLQMFLLLPIQVCLRLVVSAGVTIYQRRIEIDWIRSQR